MDFLADFMSDVVHAHGARYATDENDDQRYNA
jgi:hypothetical protein